MPPAPAHRCYNSAINHSGVSAATLINTCCVTLAPPAGRTSEASPSNQPVTTFHLHYDHISSPSNVDSTTIGLQHSTANSNQTSVKLCVRRSTVRHRPIVLIYIDIRSIAFCDCRHVNNDDGVCRVSHRQQSRPWSGAE